MRTVRVVAGCRSAAVFIAAVILAGCGNTGTAESLTATQPSPFVSIVSRPTGQPLSQTPLEPESQSKVRHSLKSTDPLQSPPQAPGLLLGLGPLIQPGLDLRAGPIELPIELRIPALDIRVPVLGVGVTSQNLMDSPTGPEGDAVWHKAFWYRGSGVPGDPGTAAIAGHVNDRQGQPGVFARLGRLVPGDLIVVHDTRSGLDIRFIVDEARTYNAEQSADPSILARIYGIGPATGRVPQPAPDGRSHLTLITCTGVMVNGAFDHHVVVYATRDS